MLKIFNQISKNKWFQSAFLGVMVFFVALIITTPEIPFIKSLSDYLVHFTLFFFVLGMMFLIFHRRKALLTCFGLSALLCVFLKNESNSRLKAPVVNNQQHVSMVHINLSNADNAESLYKNLTKVNPDVITLQELTPDWDNTLRQLLSEVYPHSFAEVRIDPYGKGVFSKFEILEVDTIPVNSVNDYRIDIIAGEEVFCLYSSYLTPALDVNSKSSALMQLQSLEDQISKRRSRSLVFGEYNMTYWNDDIRNFRNRTKLMNTRKDVLPTSLSVPYDHIFFTPDIECLKFQELNSDSGLRLGLYASFQVKKDPTKKQKIRAIQ